MRLLIDGDSCPADRRTTIANASRRIFATHASADNGQHNAHVLFFVHKSVSLSIPDVAIQHVPDADSAIIACCRADDVVITRDLLLASSVLSAQKAVQVIDYCGRPLNTDTIRERLAYRDALLSGKVQEARGARGDLQKCKKQFADSLDRIVTHAIRRRANAREGTRTPTPYGTRS